jgi:CheY-like chemotaxis protein
LTIAGGEISIGFMPSDKHLLPPGVNITFTGLEGPGQGLRYTIKVLPAYIGSGEYMDLILAAGGVAESHARLTLAEGGLFLEDLGTGELTQVNDLAVKRVRLQTGDIIELGEAKLLAQVSVPQGAALREPAPARPPRKPHAAQIWAAGFSGPVRDWFGGELGRAAEVDARAFRNGEELLMALSESLGKNRVPDLIILDLRLPVINGINSAVAVRAYELGFNRHERIPMVFLFDPPESSNFDKVLSFCQPAQAVSPRGDDEQCIRDRLTELTRDLVRA